MLCKTTITGEKPVRTLFGIRISFGNAFVLPTSARKIYHEL